MKKLLVFPPPNSARPPRRQPGCVKPRPLLLKLSPDLTPAQLDLLRKWIDEGALYEEHWAFRPPLRPAWTWLS